MTRIARSLLFVPGDRPDRFDKATASGAHGVIVDLEDAVSPERKLEARSAVSGWLTGREGAAVRINAGDSPWFNDDLQMVRSIPNAVVVLPKADLESTREVASSLPGNLIIALIETVRGLFELRQLAALGSVSRVAFGSFDFAVDSGIEDAGDALCSVRAQIVLESCHAGILPPIDGVSLELDDAVAIARDAARSRRLGFGGKLCIHPRQVAAVNQAFLPTSAELEWARKVLAADEAAGGGVTSVDGKMIDGPLVKRARRILSQ